MPSFSFWVFLTTKDINSFKLKSKASSCPWGFSPIALSLTTPHTHVHVARSVARKCRSYGCHPQRHVYQLWAWKRLSDNTSWTLQRSLMKFSQGHVSKAHSSSPWPKALKETICCWSGEPCSVIILLEPVKRPSLWGLIWSCQEGVTSLCGLPCDHKCVNGSNLLATRTLNDRQQHESLHYPQGISLICQEPECFCLSLLTVFRKPLFTC